MSDGGSWNLSSLPKNLEVVEAAGRTLRSVHDAKAEITNLVVGIDSEYVKSHYKSTIERLGRYRRRFGMQQVVLDKAIDIGALVAPVQVERVRRNVLVVDAHRRGRLPGCLSRDASWRP